MKYSVIEKERIKEAIAKEKRVNIFVALYARYKSNLLRAYLEKSGMHVTVIENDGDFNEVLSGNKFDLVITDLPEDTSKVAAHVKMVYAFSYPAIVIAVCSDYNARNAVSALNAGALCCMSHLSSYDIILSQIQALLRQRDNTIRKVSAVAMRKPVMEFGDYSINIGTGKLYYKGQHIAMAPDSVAVLAVLAENRDNIVSFNTICMKVYGVTGSRALAKLRQQIQFIRQAIGMDETLEIINQFGIGYGLSVANRY